MKECLFQHRSSASFANPGVIAEMYFISFLLSTFTAYFVMAFTAFTGAVSHFMINGIHYVSVLILCIIFTLIFARIAAVIANKSSEKVMGRTVGITLIILGIVVLTLNYA